MKFDFKDKSYDDRFYIVKKCEGCLCEFVSLIKRNGRFCGNICSTKSTAKSSTRLLKIKQTKLNRYGSETYVNPEKAKLTCIEKYGVDNASKSKVVLKKIKETTLKNHGNECFFKSEHGRLIVANIDHKYKVERGRLEMLKKYGVENPFQLDSTKDKIKSTNLKNLGVEYPMQSDIVKGKSRKTTQTKFYNDILTKSHRINIEYIPMFTIDEYKTLRDKNIYKFKCRKCDEIFDDIINSVDRPRCPTCYPITNRQSKKEIELINFIKSINVDLIQNDRDVLQNKELDIYIPDKKIAIEFNGLYWHSDLNGKNRNYHIEKLNRCNRNNIRLISIMEDEWDNKTEIVKSKLRSIFNIFQIKEHARNLKISEISQLKCNEFLTSYHIQGGCGASIRLGAYDKESNLIGVMTFGKLRRSLGSVNKDGTFEMVRFCANKKVIGLASKFIAHFKRNYNFEQIISFSDNRWSDSNNTVYEKIGFKKDSITPPNYWYFKSGYIRRFHRYNFRKSELKSKLKIFDSNISEWENMKNNGYDRIWDCGSTKWIYKNTV